MIQVFIVDDHRMVIEGLELLFREHDHISVIGSATSGEEALEVIPKSTTNVVLLDINMPDMNGIDTCKQLLNEKPDLKIIALSMHKESSLIKMMLSKGAKGYILKNAGQDELIKAVETVMDDKMYLGPEVNEIVVNSIANGGGQKKTSPFPSISRREKEVLNLILDEYTTQEIAEKLFISFGTVETHRRNMMIKLGAKNTAGLVRIALEYELNQ